MSAEMGAIAARDAERMVAEVRDDAAGRIRLAADAYAVGRVRRRYRPYRRAVVAFMRWQQARGVLNAPQDDAPGSPWWRAVNEDLLRATPSKRSFWCSVAAVTRHGRASRAGSASSTLHRRSRGTRRTTRVSLPDTSRTRGSQRSRRPPSDSS